MVNQMKLILPVSIFIILFSFHSCSKTEKGNEGNNVSDLSTIQEIQDDISTDINGDLDINYDINSDYDYEYYDDTEGFGVNFGYGSNLGYREIGKTLKKIQDDLYLNSEENSNQIKTILKKEYGKNDSFSESNTEIYLKSNKYYFQSLQSYKNNELDRAIELIETAIETMPIAVYYYHYGDFLMERNDYENAEKAFFKAFQLFDNYYCQPFVNYKMPNSDKWGKRNNVYTFDDNGIPREVYFTFYNLACIYSKRMELEKSYDFLVWAIEWGYPYIEYLFDDSDLNNLLISNNEIKDKINNIYLKGFVDEFAGKIVDFSQASTHILYSFGDDNTVYKESELGYPRFDTGYTENGTYIVKNYHIIINFYEETGLIGIGEGKVMGGNIYYDDYNRITNKINGRQLILANQAHHAIELKILYENRYR